MPAGSPIRSLSVSQPDLPMHVELSPARPLVPIEVAMFVLNAPSTDHVLAQIEDGRIEWAWDISSPGSERREVRIFWRCLTRRMFELRVEASVYNEVIPTHWGRVRAVSLQRRWACSQELIAKLIDAGSLRAITAAARGTGGSPEVTRDSTIEFLESRKI